jgi:fatty acid desaturase
MTTLDISASIQRIEANTAKLQKINAEIEAELNSATLPRSTGIPWAAVALGAVIGAGIVAIAGWVL